MKKTAHLSNDERTEEADKVFSYKGLSMSEKFIILLFLFLDDGKFMFWEKEIQE